jgi:guanine nucleotide-binding protein G(i) subunit alpha
MVRAGTILGFAIVGNRVDVSGIRGSAGIAEGFIFDLEIASLVHQLRQDQK